MRHGQKHQSDGRRPSAGTEDYGIEITSVRLVLVDCVELNSRDRM
jgi:hypothetical protein